MNSRRSSYSNRNEVDTSRLPGTVTKMVPQKHDGSRLSLYVDDKFFMGLFRKVIEKHEVDEGTLLTKQLLKQLQADEYRQEIKSYFYRILSRRDHSRTELFRKGRQKGYSDEALEIALDELEQLDLIDDAAFARQFAESKRRINRWGPEKIRAALREKGVPDTDAETAAHTAFDEVDLDKTLEHLVLKRKARFLRESDPMKRRKKVYDYLVRKGYRPNSVMQCIDHLMSTLDE